MKSILKKALHKFNLYHYLYYSPLGSILNDIRYPENKQKFKKEVGFYKGIIGDNNKLIFDIGANTGIKTKVFLTLGEKVVSVEPDRNHVKILKIRFGNNPRFTVLPVAVSDQEGEFDYYYSETASGYNTLNDKWKNSLESNLDKKDVVSVKYDGSYKVETITLQKLISIYGSPDYIKVDVEGFEWNVLKTLNQSIPYISFEANLPEFTNESNLIIRHLVGLDNRYSFNYSTNEELVLPAYISGDEMIRLLNSNQFSYMEVFCKLQK